MFSRARAQLAGVPAITPEDAQQLASRWYRAETMRMDKSGDFARWLAEDYRVTDEGTGDEYVVYHDASEVSRGRGRKLGCGGNGRALDRVLASREQPTNS